MTRGAASKNGITNFARGVWAERIAALYLWGKGYRIRARRYKTPVGEIDLIATRGRILVFVEVKVRGGLDAAVSAIPFQNYKRLRNAAEMYRASHPAFSGHNVRFDLVALAPPFGIVHLDNIDLSRA